ncbi:MAG: trimethoprim-resistant dihydrofolate reductase DfrA [Nitrospirota bacterium]|nr:trimethoprim-resistant dihydrofolate reductase DfrA [Nitrospirota bacterium]
MKLSIIVAISENGVIGAGPHIPWKAKGEQLLFKALSYNQWVLVGRKTFESMGNLPNRHYAVVTRSDYTCHDKNVIVFSSIEAALEKLETITDHVVVAGGGQVFRALIKKADILHISTIHTVVDGDVHFPPVPENFRKIFSQYFSSNIDYTYEIWERI